MSTEPAPGDLLVDRYRIESVIGSGGMATVYKATDERLDVTVAVKLLRPTLRRKADVVRRFLLEARLQARLQHPNIVNVSNVEERDGHILMVMELLKGMTLADYAHAKGGLTEKEAVSLTLPVADATAMAHRQDVVHRDIKPSNIFLAESSGTLVPKLMDFGVAREIDSSFTSSTTLLGTLPYMSFELVQSARNASPASDVYALGVTLFELIVGHHPIQARTLQEYIYALMNTERVPSLKSVRPDVSEALDAVVARALVKDAAGRYPDASALVEALRALPEGRATAGASPRKPPEPARPRSASKPEGLVRLESTFSVAGQLGCGPIGTVYRCTNTDGDSLAVKLLKPEHARVPERARHFLDSAAHQGQVARRSPFVQPIVSTHVDFNGVATEQPDGGTLASMLETYGRFDAAYTVQLFTLLAEGLETAHHAGLVHGHIHPGNIYLARQPDGIMTPLWMDMGQALMLPRDQIDALGADVVYLAPELGGRLDRANPASDVYALGMTLYRVLAGALPWSADTLEASAHKLDELGAVPDLHTAQPEVPRDLSNVVGWCLSVSPAHRYRDISQVHRDLLAVRAQIAGY